MKSVYYLLSFFGVISIFSCADDTEVGSGLLGSQDIEVVFEDDFDLKLRHIGPTPFNQTNISTPLDQTNSAISTTLPHSLGTLQDGVFGFSSVDIYVRPTLFTSSTRPDFAFGTLDSVFLALKMDTNSFYGDQRSFFDIEVYELAESIEGLDSISTDRSFQTNLEPLGVVDRFVPANTDSLLTYDNSGDSLYAQNVLTVPLDRRFGAKIFIDTINNQTASGLASLTNGFLIRATSNNALLPINLFDEVSSLLFYFRDSSGVVSNFPYRFGAPRPMNFSYDLSSSQLEAAINNNDNDNELYFLQGHAGTTIEIDIEDILKITDPFVNHASIELFAEQEGIIDTSFFSLPPALDLFKIDDDGNVEFVNDLLLANSNNLPSVFDGNLEKDEVTNIVSYEMNITSYIKSFLEGEEPSKVYLRVRNRVQTPNALIFYGPNHPTYPIKLKLTYTKS